jgi:hypothetical protein
MLLSLTPATGPWEIFGWATKVTSGYALYAYGIAGVVAIIWILNTTRKGTDRSIPRGAWVILALAICMPAVSPAQSRMLTRVVHWRTHTSRLAMLRCEAKRTATMKFHSLSETSDWGHSL